MRYLLFVLLMLISFVCLAVAFTCVDKKCRPIAGLGTVNASDIVNRKVEARIEIQSNKAKIDELNLIIADNGAQKAAEAVAKAKAEKNRLRETNDLLQVEVVRYRSLLSTLRSSGANISNDDLT